MAIQDRQVTMTAWTAYGGYLSDLVGKFSRWLPKYDVFHQWQERAVHSIQLSVLIESPKPGYTTDLYPMFSMSKVSPCFSNILYPTQYYYERSWRSGKFAFLDNVPWDEKKSRICQSHSSLHSHWRGTANGGLIIGDNYHHFPRFRLMHIEQKHLDLMDV
ncbi:hypothetical protein B0H14DRAFT_2599349 [Mycena olivaceomarginata]|nr:hypothetical protein B0H14DRAFT_2599349 [Mycena olivaceomarginata]